MLKRNTMEQHNNVGLIRPPMNKNYKKGIFSLSSSNQYPKKTTSGANALMYYPVKNKQRFS